MSNIKQLQCATDFSKNNISRQIIEHKKKSLHMALEILVLAQDRHKNVAGQTS
jgi:hypothetical protein